MSANIPTIPVPVSIVQEVERYVDDELADAKKFDNRTPLDESGVWSLHEVVARAYAKGFSDGQFAADEKARRRASRAEAREAAS